MEKTAYIYIYLEANFIPNISSECVSRETNVLMAVEPPMIFHGGSYIIIEFVWKVHLLNLRSHATDLKKRIGANYFSW